MINEYSDFEQFVRQLDEEIAEEESDFSGLIVGSGALAYHAVQDGREYQDSIKDLDIFTEPNYLHNISQMDHGCATPDREFGGAIYALGKGREKLEEEAENWDLINGDYGKVFNADFLTKHPNAGVEWQLKADLRNGEGSEIPETNTDLRVVPLSTYLSTKEHGKGEKNQRHRELAQLIID
jgi:hypothetical protein